jgi:hypothetical protein
MALWLAVPADGQEFFGNFGLQFPEKIKDAAESGEGNVSPALGIRRVRPLQRTNDYGGKNRCASGVAALHELRRGL